MDLVSAGREGFSQFCGNYATATIYRITSDAYFHQDAGWERERGLMFAAFFSKTVGVKLTSTEQVAIVFLFALARIRRSAVHLMIWNTFSLQTYFYSDRYNINKESGL